LICASNDSFYFHGYYSNNSNNYAVLSNDTGWVIFDGKNKRLTKDPQTMNYLLAKAENSFSFDTTSSHYRIKKGKPEIEKFCYNCPSWYDENDSSVRLMPWQSSLLFDSLFTGETFIPDTDGFYYVYSCKECMKRKVRHNFDYEFGKNYDRTVLNHTVRFVNDSVISVTRENLSRSYSYVEYPSDIFFTVMLFKDGPHGMLLDSLFNGNDWKKFITYQVMNYLDSGLYITGNCSNPYMMPFVLKNRFTITEDGILLFPPGYRQDGNQLAILVSWEKLKPYLRKDVASKIRINN
jgi:hypothetical protein